MKPPENGQPDAGGDAERVEAPEGAVVIEPFEAVMSPQGFQIGTIELPDGGRMTQVTFGSPGANVHLQFTNPEGLERAADAMKEQAKVMASRLHVAAANELPGTPQQNVHPRQGPRR